MDQFNNWYEIKEIQEDLFWVREPGHVSFFIFRSGSEALFVDSGLGLREDLAKSLLEKLGISTFDVICTHAHCDHIGLNYLARHVYLSKREWEKYLVQNEKKQLSYYYKALKDVKAWPQGGPERILTKEWRPTSFLQEKDIISLGQWKIRAISSAGHTSGSLMFLEESIPALFVGDLIYTGMMYLHLKDSDYEEFKTSLGKVLKLKSENASLSIWPSHNKIPLPGLFPESVARFIDDYESGLISDIQPYLKDDIFEDGWILNHQGISLTVKRKT